MQARGQKVHYHKLSDEQFLAELKRKLLEEIAEFAKAEEKPLDELADLLEVIESAAKQIGSGIHE